MNPSNKFGSIKNIIRLRDKGSTIPINLIKLRVTSNLSFLLIKS
ncbi:unnamed protein product [marine sediment metagenome]|uniref:Uncharacterized protein n=1 Tax=marine sediment metagenome TaxID=412755 RepID=X1T847_9ZZZZ